MTEKRYGMNSLSEDSEEFRVCSACGYGHGFNVDFRRNPEGLGIGLTCPSCGCSYDLGWVTPDAPDIAPTPGPVFSGRP